MALGPRMEGHLISWDRGLGREGADRREWASGPPQEPRE